MWASRGLGGALDWPTRGLGVVVVPVGLPGGTVTITDIAPDIHFLILVPEIELGLPDDSSLSLAAATVEMRMAPYLRLEVTSPTVSFGFTGPTVSFGFTGPSVSFAVELAGIVVSETAPFQMGVAAQSTIGVSDATVVVMSSEDNP